MTDSRPEFHLYEDLSLTPAYAMGHAFHALGRIDSKTCIRGPRGVLVMLNELFATLTSLKLEASLVAAEPLRVQQEAMVSRPGANRIGPVSAAEITSALLSVELCVREELRVRATAIDQKRRSAPPSHAQALLGVAAFESCPEVLRCELIDACRALDARLYTASIFHFYRVWERLPGGNAQTVAGAELPVADPRGSPAVRHGQDEADRVFEAVRRRLKEAGGQDP
jgi:hypothetical protein